MARFLVSVELKTLSSSAITPQVAGTYDGWPDWSPDSNEIVFSRFVSGAGTGAAIRIVKATGGKSKLVTAPMPGTDSHHTMPVWSPDGKKIAYCHLDDDEAWGHIYTIEPDGSGQHADHLRPGDRRGPGLARGLTQPGGSEAAVRTRTASATSSVTWMVELRSPNGESAINGRSSFSIGSVSVQNARSRKTYAPLAPSVP